MEIYIAFAGTASIETKLHLHFPVKFRGRRRTRSKLFFLSRRQRSHSRLDGLAAQTQQKEGSQPGAHTHPLCFASGSCGHQRQHFWMPSNRKQAWTRQPNASTHTEDAPTPTHTYRDRHSDTRGVRGRRAPGCRLQAGISFRSGAGSPGSPAAFPGPGKRESFQGRGGANLCRPRGSQKRVPMRGVPGSTRAPRRPYLGMAAGRLPDNFPPRLPSAFTPARYALHTRPTPTALLALHASSRTGGSTRTFPLYLFFLYIYSSDRKSVV